MSVLDGGGFPGSSGPTRTRPHGNLRALKIAVFIAFGLLALQLANMQIVQGEDYRQRSEENHLRVANIIPPRGLIYDRDMTPLVANVPTYQVSIVPELLTENREARYRIYLALEDLLGIPALDIQTDVDNQEKDGVGYIAIFLDKLLSKDEALQVQQMTADIPGVSLEVTPGRKYIEGNTLAHILGHVSKQREEDGNYYTKQGYALNELVGVSGIEYTYEKDLRGLPGLSSNEEDAAGNVVSRLETRDPEAGGSVRLGIDLDLQQFVYEQLESNMKEATEAAAVVMNAKTGEIYAMVSYPGFDNNLFSELGEREDEYNALLKDPRKPFLNRALSAEAPGSTFKLLTAAAALQEGNVVPSDGRNVGSTVLEIKGVNGEIYPLLDWNAHGWVDLYSGIAKSSNHYFYMVSCGVQAEGKFGLSKTEFDPERSAYILAGYAKRFGFGGPTGIDIGGEADGIIPDPAWKMRTHRGVGFNPDEGTWYYADTCFMGIGQGDVTATPMQIARMTAAVANGGTLVTPHVADAILDTQGNVIREIQPEGKKIEGMDPQHLADIREGMRQSVNFGDGAGVQASYAAPGVSISGKTGTAEFGGIDAATGKQFQHAWFTGFAPTEDPTFVVTVYFNLGVGGEKAAPVAGRILKFAVENVTP